MPARSAARAAARLAVFLVPFLTSAAHAGPVRADHPLLGAWALQLGDGACTEVYRIDRAGTTLVTSAEEVAESRFTLSDQPSERGYYKWVAPW